MLTKTPEEFNYQLASLKAAGIGPWLNETLELQAAGTYCGTNLTFAASIQLTQNFGIYPSNGTYWEIFRFLGNERSFFSDFYDAHGPSLFYVGMTTKPGYSYAGLAKFLQANGIPIIFSFTVPNVYPEPIVWIRLGYIFAEIVVGQDPT